MQSVSDFLSRAVVFLRDLFNYLLPTIPLFLWILYVFEGKITPIMVVMGEKYPFLSGPVVRETIGIALIYALGRAVNLASQGLDFVMHRMFIEPVQSRGSATVRNDIVPDQQLSELESRLGITRYVQVRNVIQTQYDQRHPGHNLDPSSQSELPEEILHAEVFDRKERYYETFVERYNIVSMYEQSLSSALFCMGVLSFWLEQNRGWESCDMMWMAVIFFATAFFLWFLYLTSYTQFLQSVCAGRELFQ
jgi:hypothetical protein